MFFLYGLIGMILWDNDGIILGYAWIYPLVMTNSLLSKPWPIDSLFCPLEIMILYSYVGYVCLPEGTHFTIVYRKLP